MAESIIECKSRGILLQSRVSCNQRPVLPLILPVLKIDIVIPYSSSSTPTVPYSTADILYGSDVHGGSRNLGADDLRQSGCTDSERSSKEAMRQKAKDLDHPSNRRPSSKTGKQRAISIDTGKLDFLYILVFASIILRQLY